MQTDLRGRDLISLQEWTKEEIDTVLDVAFQLKRERALGIPHPLLRDRVLAMLFFFSTTRTRASFEAGMAQLGGHAQFIESRTTQIAHGDTAKEIGEILGRYNDGIAIRNVDWGVGNQLHPRGGRGQPGAGPQHAVRPLPPPPVAGRPDDDHREEGRSAGPDDRDQLGLRGQLPEADQRARRPLAADHALRDERPAGPSAGVPAPARHRRRRRPRTPAARAAASS